MSADGQTTEIVPLRASVLTEAMNRILDNRDEDEDGPEVTQGMVNAAALLALMIEQDKPRKTPGPTDTEGHEGHQPNRCCDYHRHVADGCCHCDLLGDPDSHEWLGGDR